MSKIYLDIALNKNLYPYFLKNAFFITEINKTIAKFSDWKYFFQRIQFTLKI